MTVHIENMTSEVVAIDGDFPLNDEQLERVASYVISKMEQRSMEQQLLREATSIGSMAEPQAHWPEVD